ncbi:MAG: branched-chain amino acid ABC transporter permease [Phycicoccus sp.]|nr:branched-chain amino acid ABC transporter permease [Phycicoccus sp.]
MSTATLTQTDESAEPTRRTHPSAWIMSAVGAVLLAGSAFLSWSYDPDVLGNLTVYGYPGAVQILAIILGALALVVVGLRTKPVVPWFNTTAALRTLGFGAVIFMVFVILGITLESSGLINVDPGGWVALVGALLMAAGGYLMPDLGHTDPLRAKAPDWVEILIITGMMAGLLFTAAYALGIDDGGSFVALLAFLGATVMGLVRGGFFQWLSVVSQRHRRVLMLGAIAVAFLFPFTQDGSDANMSIATQVLIFATTALGLNIVVGLAGLLDLGYIAFLGAGAYVGAMLSGAATATIGWSPPFLVVMLIGAAVSATLGLIIGSPTLRVSGDYLAIVTLAFGEIFRISVNNMDGKDGPDLTHGPNGIAGIPELTIPFTDFSFGDTHQLFGFTVSRYANYYFLLLLLAAFVIMVFTRLNNSRIGRGWVAIREDERAAEAMGVNVFGLKLLAFAGGASLAGLAGTIKAHQDLAVSPDQYVFLESAFLLAAVVLGGMGTVAGVLVGATILKLLPEKLRFLSDYRLLMFGALLVLMMRFRPEGLVPSKRRQLEFHEDDEHLAEAVQDEHIEQTEAKA